MTDLYTLKECKDAAIVACCTSSTRIYKYVRKGMGSHCLYCTNCETIIVLTNQEFDMLLVTTSFLLKLKQS